jgi:hypothetical protein
VGRIYDRRKVAVVVIGSVLVTSVLLAAVFGLGSWAYQTRRFLLHERRLAKLLDAHPTADDVTVALLADPAVKALPSPPSDEQLLEFANTLKPARGTEVLGLRRSNPDLRMFAVGGVVYFLFFDREGRLQAYVLAGK